jgi:hypothetical protein
MAQHFNDDMISHYDDQYRIIKYWAAPVADSPALYLPLRGLPTGGFIQHFTHG